MKVVTVYPLKILDFSICLQGMCFLPYPSFQNQRKIQLYPGNILYYICFIKSMGGYTDFISCGLFNKILS